MRPPMLTLCGLPPQDVQTGVCRRCCCAPSQLTTAVLRLETLCYIRITITRPDSNNVFTEINARYRKQKTFSRVHTVDRR